MVQFFLQNYFNEAFEINPEGQMKENDLVLRKLPDEF